MKVKLGKSVTYICFRYEENTGEERNLVIFEDKPINNRIDL